MSFSTLSNFLFFGREAGTGGKGKVVAAERADTDSESDDDGEHKSNDGGGGGSSSRGVRLIDVRAEAAAAKAAADKAVADKYAADRRELLDVTNELIKQSKDDAEERKRARNAAREQAQLDLVIPESSVATCQLRTFLDSLALKLGLPNSDTLVDWTSREVLSLSESSTDAEVLRTMRTGAYAVSRTLFWMQNRECFSHVHLMRHIVASHEWSARFFEALLLVVPPIKEKHSTPEEEKANREDKRAAAPALSRMPRAKWELLAQHHQLVQLRERFSQPLPKEVGTEKDRVQPVRFILPRAPPLSGRGAHHVTLELAMFRDASRNQNLTEEHRAAALTRFLARDLHITDPEQAKEAVQRLSSRQHALLTLTRVLAMDFAPRPATSVAWNYSLLDRAAIVEWIRHFLIEGCACTS